MTVELLTEHHLEFLSSKGGCTGSSESTLVKMPHCWKSLCDGGGVLRIVRDTRIGLCFRNNQNLFYGELIE